MPEKNHARSRMLALLVVIATWGSADVTTGAPDAHAAQPGPDPTSEAQIEASSYTIRWYTIDSGGTTSSDGTLVLTGTAGQTDAVSSSDGTLTVKGGFRSASTQQRIFQDDFESGDLSRWPAVVGN